MKLLRERTEDAQLRKVWSLKHGQDMYGIDEDDLHCNVDVAAKGRKKKKRPPKCKACGLSKHNHKDCPKRTCRGTTTSLHTH